MSSAPRHSAFPEDFDVDGPADPDAGFLGLDPDPAGAEVALLAAPFDATTSYRAGARLGPAAVLAASHQVELTCPLFGDTWRRGLWWRGEIESVAGLQAEVAEPARRVIEVGGDVADRPELQLDLQLVNDAGEEVNAWVQGAVETQLDLGRLPVLIGGDHSVPFGAIAAVAARHPGVGLLHVDAHADLRVAYEGFTWSHASILHNVLDQLDVGPLVQLGLRDLGAAELERIARSEGRISALLDRDWQRAKLEGRNLSALIDEQLEHLPNEVYVTVDIDGLDPTLCPHTGTPVPGGFLWHEVDLLLERLAASGKRVLGLDLVEVAPGPDPRDAVGEPTDSWDAIVGARLLYRLIGAALANR